MSSWADWIAITSEQSDLFLSTLRFRDNAIEKLIQDLLEKVQEAPTDMLHVQMDKAWEPIHRCLTGDISSGLDFQAGDFPISFCVLGGAQLLFEHSYRTASLVLPDEVQAASSALQTVKREVFQKAFLNLPEIYFHEVNEEVFEWVWEHF